MVRPSPKSDHLLELRIVVIVRTFAVKSAIVISVPSLSIVMRVA